MNTTLRYRIMLLSVMALFLVSCWKSDENSGPVYVRDTSGKSGHVYRFAVHPLHNPAKLSQAYQPLVDYLDNALPESSMVLEASKDYANFESKIRKGDLEFLLPNPWQTLEAMKEGYEVIAMAGEPSDFKGIIIVRKDGRVEKPLDLKGKTVSYPAPTALAACIMPQFFLHLHGIDVNRDIHNIYVGSQESSIMNVFLKQSTAGATWPPPWRAFQKEHPKESSALEVKWETPHLINNSVMARKNLPEDVKNKIRNALLQLKDAPLGSEILSGMETRGFYPANDKNYDVVRAYIAQFEKDVRPVRSQ